MNDIEKKIEKLYDQMEIGFTQIALDLAQELDELGIEAGTFCLSTFYHYGHIVEQNYNKEFKLLKKAANHGSKRAKFNIASSYLGGFGVKKNEKKAHKIMYKLADDGYEPAIHFLIQNSIASGQMSIEELDKAGIKPIAEFEIPCSDIDEDTNKMLSKMMANSNSGEIAIPITNKNTEKMLANKMLKDFFDNLDIDIKRSYSIASELHTMNRIEGYFALGILYCFGIHVKMDIEKGTNLLLNAFRQGYLPASYIFAVVLGSAGNMQKSKDISLEVMKNLADDGYKPAIEALKENSDGMPDGVHLSYEYLCE